MAGVAMTLIRELLLPFSNKHGMNGWSSYDSHKRVTPEICKQAWVNGGSSYDPHYKVSPAIFKKAHVIRINNYDFNKRVTPTFFSKAWRNGGSSNYYHEGYCRSFKIRVFKWQEELFLPFLNKHW